jgi:hypothetical protein
LLIAICLDTRQWEQVLGPAFDEFGDANFNVRINIVATQQFEQQSLMLRAAQYPQVLTAIIHHLDVRDIQHLSCTCNYLHRSLRGRTRIRHPPSNSFPVILTKTPFINVMALRIASSTHRFFASNFHGFCRLLRQTGAIMWNDVAVRALLDPGTTDDWALTRLDLIVCDAQLPYIDAFLFESGYTPGLHETTHADRFYSDAQVWTRDKVSVTVCIVNANRATPAMVLAQAPGSQCMTWFSGSRIGCEFPHLTFNRLIEFNYNNPYASQQLFVDTYRIWVVDRNFDWHGDEPPDINWSRHKAWTVSIMDSGLCM